MLNSGYPQAYSNGLTPVFIIQWELVTHHLSLTCWSHIWTDWLSIHAQLITPKQSWHIFGFFLYFLIQTIPPSPSKQSRVQPIIRSAENKQLLFLFLNSFLSEKQKNRHWLTLLSGLHQRQPGELPKQTSWDRHKAARQHAQHPPLGQCVLPGFPLAVTR